LADAFVADAGTDQLDQLFVFGELQPSSARRPNTMSAHSRALATASGPLTVSWPIALKPFS
jgi:hypothetical protein